MNFKTLFLFAFVVLFSFVSCFKERKVPINYNDLPKLSTINGNQFWDFWSLANLNKKYVGGIVYSQGASPVTERGFCWSTSPDFDINDHHLAVGKDTGSFSAVLTDLQPNTRYFLKAYAKNNHGINYGWAISFITNRKLTEVGDGVIDIDGNKYKTVKLITGDEFMAENLRVTRYNDGKPIPELKNDQDWLSTKKGGYCNYNNEYQIEPKYGLLYNYYTVQTEKICPAGWHVSTDDELSNLHFLFWQPDNGENFKAKYDWSKIGKDTFALSAYPAGERQYVFNNRGISTGWWVMSYYKDYSDKYIGLQFTLSGFVEDSKNKGLSIRCVKDREDEK
jgi:uncharacterized protein (TIGR02145 family)